MASKNFATRGLTMLRPSIGRTSLTRSHSLSSVSHVTPNLDLGLAAKAAKINKQSAFSEHAKFTAGWWKDVAIVGTVFSITGSCTAAFVPRTINSLGIQGSLKEGPWTYRVTHFSVSPPTWCALLVAFGTCFGKRQYFSSVALKVLGRFAYIGRLPSRILVKSA